MSYSRFGLLANSALVVLATLPLAGCVKEPQEQPAAIIRGGNTGTVVTKLPPRLDPQIRERCSGIMITKIGQAPTIAQATQGAIVFWEAEAMATIGAASANYANASQKSSSCGSQPSGGGVQFNCSVSGIPCTP